MFTSVALLMPSAIVVLLHLMKIRGIKTYTVSAATVAYAGLLQLNFTQVLSSTDNAALVAGLGIATVFARFFTGKES